MIKENFGNLFEQAKKVQENVAKAQEEIKNTEVIGTSGAGMVKVTMKGNYSTVSIKLENSLLKEELTITEELITAAVNDAIKKASDLKTDIMKKHTGIAGFPNDFKIPTF